MTQPRFSFSASAGQQWPCLRASNQKSSKFTPDLSCSRLCLVTPLDKDSWIHLTPIGNDGLTENCVSVQHETRLFPGGSPQGIDCALNSE